MCSASACLIAFASASCAIRVRPHLVGQVEGADHPNMRSFLGVPISTPEGVVAHAPDDTPVRAGYERAGGSLFCGPRKYSHNGGMAFAG
jgi:hypothetical protein